MADVSAGDCAWLLTATAFVLVMTPGLAFFYGGLVRGRNVLNTMLMSIISMGIVAMTWLACGFSLAFGTGGGGFIGDLSFAGLRGLEDAVWPGTGIPTLLFVAFQMTFAIIGAAIISGAIVERMRFSAYVIFISLWSVLVYGPIAHWVWGSNGWIFNLGGKDFAGGTVVHMSTACSALVLAILLGPRTGYTKNGKPPPHNVPFVILGAGLLWFGWSGFNGGSALAAGQSASLALINTYLAASAAMCTWTFIERAHAKRFAAVGPVTGAIVGLVIITPAAGYVTPLGAAGMGTLGCLLVYPSFQFSHDKVDDSLDAFPCHGCSGFVGTVLTGVFARDGGLLFGGGLRLVGVQLLAGVAVFVYAAGCTVLLYGLLRLVMETRVAEEAELSGLDLTLHGDDAYGPAKDEFSSRMSFRDLCAGTNASTANAGPADSSESEDSGAAGQP